jgi:hypothetical protein
MGTPTKRYDICAGKAYTTRDGAQKKQWIRVGKLTEWDDGGPSIELDAVPTGNWFDGKLACFEQTEGQRGEAKPQRQAPQSDNADPFADHIPFD